MARHVTILRELLIVTEDFAQIYVLLIGGRHDSLSLSVVKSLEIRETRHLFANRCLFPTR